MMNNVVAREDADRWILPNRREAVQWCRERNLGGIRGVLDVLGRYSLDSALVDRHARMYVSTVKDMERSGLNASLSLKLSTIGASFDRELARRKALNICIAGARHGVGIELDMEGKGFIDLAIQTAIECTGEGAPVALTLQAYLDRTPADIEKAVKRGLRIRLVKGAYLGDVSDFAEIADRFRALAARLSQTGLPFSLGTHDPQLIEWAKELPVDRKLLEFGFLKGLADRTKLALASEGRRVAEYIPFGKEGEAYVLRRRAYLRHLDELGRAPAP
jgi:proline dehydrogenase